VGGGLSRPHPGGRILPRVIITPLTRGANAARRKPAFEIPLHDLRHTYASHLAMRGMHIRALQELLGHKTLATTRRYFHLAPEQLQNAVKLLDGVIGDKRELVGQAAS
jgi:site-specific recombinase XerD